jgi:hypothetical protein
MSGLPDPAKLTIGNVADALRYIDRFGWGGQMVMPSQIQDNVRQYRERLSASPEYGRLADWVELNLGVAISSDAVDQVIARLKAITRQPINFVRSMSVTDALEVLDAPSPADGGRREASKARKGQGKTGKTADPRSVDDLTPTAWRLLRALLKIGAIDAGTARSRSQIVEEAGDVGNADSRNVRDAFTMLGKLGLVATQRHVGTWLTQAGLDAARRRR